MWPETESSNSRVLVIWRRLARSSPEIYTCGGTRATNDASGSAAVMLLIGAPGRYPWSAHRPPAASPSMLQALLARHVRVLSWGSKLRQRS